MRKWIAFGMAILMAMTMSVQVVAIDATEIGDPMPEDIPEEESVVENIEVQPSIEPDVEVNTEDIEVQPSIEPDVEVSTDDVEQISDACEDLQSYIQQKQLAIDISMDDLLKNYDEEVYGDVENYLKFYYEAIDNAEAAQEEVEQNGQAWYYNTGTSLPQAAPYNRNILASVQKGDIVYEAYGGYGVTGHIAIVEGKYYSAAKKQFYVRLIEAIKPGGVCRSVLVDQRVLDKDVTVYRVTNATNAQRNAAVNFCISQLGKDYALDVPAKDYDSSQADWYCSELVWAAYYRQGIDIETTGVVNEPGVTPRDIARSNKLTTCPIDGAKPENLFTDIIGHWANAHIKYVVSNGLMSGTSTTTFSPNTAMSRASLVTVLYKMKNMPNAGSHPFTDVASSAWYRDAVAWAYNTGLASGTSSTTFSPNTNITRESVACILYKYAQKNGYNVAYSTTSLDSFSDKGSVSSYAVTAMRWAVSRGVMSGSGGKLNPKANMTRAEAAAVLRNMLEKTARD